MYQQPPRHRESVGIQRLGSAIKKTVHQSRSQLTKAASTTMSMVDCLHVDIQKSTVFGWTEKICHFPYYYQVQFNWATYILFYLHSPRRPLADEVEHISYSHVNK